MVAGLVESRGMSYVYVIRQSNYVKIGTTTDPESRLKVLKSINKGVLTPEDIDGETEVMMCVMGDAHTEHALHLMFREQRVIGEWYSYDGALKTWCDALTSTNKDLVRGFPIPEPTLPPFTYEEDGETRTYMPVEL